MAAMLISDELAVRTDRAVAAAAGAGRDLGLTVTDPRVLYDVFSVVVHLSVAREPVRRDGFSMTFWQFVEQIPDAGSDADRGAGRGGTVTAQLHAALREYPAELPFLVPLDSFVADGLAQLERRPDLLEAADFDRARREWAVLEPVVGSRTAFEAAFPGAAVQPIHGDAPFYNIIVTPEGELCSDFEYVSLGPVERDLPLAGPHVQAAYDAAAAELGLRPLDERLLRVMESVGLLQAVACFALVPQLPMLVESLRPLLDHWRTMPLARGLEETGSPR